ncbi:MAG: phosphoribosylglycinamide formyltransferase [Rhodospirillales bacterium]|nr:phosphoribosylglycinamide formyltransferase [Rhodospirillales bacterium]
MSETDRPAGTPTPRRRRVGVLLSGRGSNLGALLDAAARPEAPFSIALVLSNNADAAGLTRAAAAGVATAAIDHRPYGRDRAAHEAAIDTELRAAGVEIVCLAGYLRLLSPFLVGAWRGRMLNIHPSLLPVFPGLHTHERALAAGVKLHGCTVHLVTEGMDEGPILAQAAVPVLAEDDADTLAARVLVQEHRLYPAALWRFATGMADGAAPQAFLMNPPPLPELSAFS